MTYPYRFPLSRFISSLGVTLTIKVSVFKDDEAGVFVATSPDIQGLVIEAESFAQLRDEVAEAIPALLSLDKNLAPTHASAELLYTDRIAIA